MKDKEVIREIIDEVLNDLPSHQKRYYKEDLASIEVYDSTFKRINLKSFLAGLTYGEYIDHLVLEDTKDIENIEMISTLLNL